MSKRRPPRKDSKVKAAQQKRGGKKQAHSVKMVRGKYIGG